jgi:hypothetical protein
VTRALAALLLAVALLAPTGAHAAACCMSATVGGFGRLRAWESIAAGATASVASARGQWDGDGAWRPFASAYSETELRAVKLLNLRVELAAFARWGLGHRA